MAIIDYRGFSTNTDSIRVNDGDTIIVHQFEADGVTPVDFNGSTLRISSDTGQPVKVTIIFDGDYSASNLGTFVINNGVGVNGDDVVADLIVKEGSTVVNDFEYSGFPGGTAADPTITTITLEDDVTFEGSIELNDPQSNNTNAIINITTGDNVKIGVDGTDTNDTFISGNIRGSDDHQVNVTLGENNTLFSILNDTQFLALNSSGTTPLNISGSTIDVDNSAFLTTNGLSNLDITTITSTNIIANNVTIESSTHQFVLGHQGDDVIEMNGLVVNNITTDGRLVLTTGTGDDTWTIGGDAIHTGTDPADSITFRALTVDGGLPDDDNDTLIFRPVNQAQLDEFIASLEANLDETKTSGTAGVNAVGDAYTIANADADANNGVFINQTDGSGNILFTQFETIIIGDFICFAAGTLIDTPNGRTAVEDLVVGDLVETFDNGAQPVRWIKSRKISKADLAANPKLTPIKIQAGSLGQNMPMQDLVVSPQHRIMVSSRLSKRMFGEREALVAAKQLLPIAGVDYADVDEVTYVHFMCDQHEIVFAEGMPSETLYAGKETLKTIPRESVEELFAIFPELHEVENGFVPEPARLLVRGRLARNFANRAARNKRELFSLR